MKYIVSILAQRQIEVSADNAEEAMKIAENEVPVGWDFQIDDVHKERRTETKKNDR